MPLIPLTCPCCGGNITVNSDHDAAVCSYCGKPFIVKDAIVQNYINNVLNINADTVNVYSQKDFEIESGVLKDYKGEAVDVVIPDNVKYIGEKAFEGLYIESVVIPASVKEIRAHAFKDCVDLKFVDLHRDDVLIKRNAFDGCKSLPNDSRVMSVLKKQMYEEAMSYYRDGFYKEAYDLLNGLSYKDSSQMAEKLEKILKKVGTVIMFGGLPWIILEIRGKNALLLSQKIIGHEPYNKEGSMTTWEDCSLRRKLNGDFYNRQFSKNEKRKIVNATVPADKNSWCPNSDPGNATEDYIFLLSTEEAEKKYFSSETSRIALDSKGERSEWWLRTPGDDNGYAAHVLDNGRVYHIGAYINDVYGVRPALWMEL